MKSGFKSPVWVFKTRNFFRFEINQDLKKLVFILLYLSHSQPFHKPVLFFLYHFAKSSVDIENNKYKQPIAQGSLVGSNGVKIQLVIFFYIFEKKINDKINCKLSKFQIKGTGLNIPDFALFVGSLFTLFSIDVRFKLWKSL